MDGAIVGDDHILHLVVPKTKINKLAEEPRAHDLEFTSKDTTSIDVAIGNVNQSTIKTRDEFGTHLV